MSSLVTGDTELWALKSSQAVKQSTMLSVTVINHSGYLVWHLTKNGLKPAALRYKPLVWLLLVGLDREVKFSGSLQSTPQVSDYYQGEIE